VQPMPATPGAGYGVKRRAAKVASSCEWKAHTNVDVFRSTVLRQVMLARWRKRSRRVTPLVFGQFGEICPEFDTLLQQAAESGAARLRDALYIREKTAEQAQAVLPWKLSMLL
jgi:hypothetical protein